MKRKSFLLRIEQEMYQQLEAWAQQELRSVNSQIEFLLKQALAKRQGNLDKPDGKDAKSG